MCNFEETLIRCLDYSEDDVKREWKNNKDDNCELAKSFNYLDFNRDYKSENKAVANENTELLIVGTLSPHKGRKNGYYYSADGNDQLEILEKCIELTIPNEYKNKESELNGLVDYKNNLVKNPKNTTTINAIEGILNENHIAFIDVIKCAVTPINSASDNKIKCFCLDREAFIKFFKTNKGKASIVFNSRNAEIAFLKMFNFGYAPQILYKDRETKYNCWKKELEITLKKNTSIQLKNN